MELLLHFAAATVVRRYLKSWSGTGSHMVDNYDWSLPPLVQVRPNVLLKPSGTA